MGGSVDGVPDIVSGGHSFISNRDDPAKVKLLFNASEVWPVGQAVIGISRKKLIGDGDSLAVHEQSHLQDGVWTVFFGNAFTQEVILFFGLEIIVCNIIVNQAGIPARVLLNLVIEPYLQVVLVLVQKREAAVDIIQGVVCFFKETVPVFIRRFL